MAKKEDDSKPENLSGLSEDEFLDFSEQDDKEICCFKIKLINQDYERYLPLKKKCLIGSDPKCDLEIAHPSIVSKHVRLVNHKDHVLLEVLTDTKVYSANGAPLKKDGVYRLRINRSVRIGDFMLSIFDEMPLELDHNVERKLIFDGIGEDSKDHLRLKEKPKDQEGGFFQNEADEYGEIEEVELETNIIHRLMALVVDFSISVLAFQILSLHNSLKEILLRFHYSVVSQLNNFFGAVLDFSRVEKITFLFPSLFLFFLLSFFSHILLKVTFGQSLLGLVSKSIHKKKTQDLIRYFVGLFTWPFLVFDFPLVLGKRTLKEKLSSTIVVRGNRLVTLDAVAGIVALAIFGAVGFNYKFSQGEKLKNSIGKNKLNEVKAHAWVNLIKGEARYIAPNGVKQVSIKKGMEILDESLVTTKEKSRVVISFPNKTKLGLGPNSSMRINYNVKSERSVISLLKGKIRAFVRPSGSENKLIIATEYSSVGVRGTEFLLSLSDKTNRVSVLGFSGRTIVMSMLNPDLDIEKPSDNFLEQAFSKGKHEIVEAGRVAVVNPVLFEASKPVKISPLQYGILKEKDALQVSVGDHREDYKDGDNRFTEPLPGGYIDFESGQYLQPTKESDYDEALGVFIVKKEDGTVDAATGAYIPPAGYELTKDGFTHSGYTSDEEKEKLNKLNSRIYKGTAVDIYKVFNYLKSNYSVMVDNYRMWKEVDGLIGANVFQYALKVNRLSEYVLSSIKLDGKLAHLNIYDQLLNNRSVIRKYSESFPKDLVAVTDSFGLSTSMLDDDQYISPSILAKLEGIGRRYKTLTGEDLILKKLTFKDGGAVKGCREHSQGLSVDVTSNKIDLSKDQFNKETFIALLKIAKEEGVKRVFLGSNDIISELDEFSGIELLYSESHKNSIHLGFSNK